MFLLKCFTSTTLNLHIFITTTIIKRERLQQWNYIGMEIAERSGVGYPVLCAVIPRRRRSRSGKPFVVCFRRCKADWGLVPRWMLRWQHWRCVENGGVGTAPGCWGWAATRMWRGHQQGCWLCRWLSRSPVQSEPRCSGPPVCDRSSFSYSWVWHGTWGAKGHSGEEKKKEKKKNLHI